QRRGRTADPVRRDRLARLYSQIACMRWSTARELAKIGQGNQPSATMGGLAKLAWAGASQDLASLAVEVLGPAALVEPGPLGSWSHALAASPSSSIAGGTSDINRNIVAEHGLGLAR
ncbi:MAG TPA: acyl-CoA dehydrogenase family protein, partial [Acidimicrobiales bacterium]|nr:acyl-CoA dehydrogenase family protein [Acidimicrobiales bacterium]